MELYKNKHDLSHEVIKGTFDQRNYTGIGLRSQIDFKRPNSKTRRIATIFLQNIKMSEQQFLRTAPSAALGVSCSSVNACKNASHLYGKIPVKARNIERGCQQCLRDAIRSVHNVNIKIKSS